MKNSKITLMRFAISFAIGFLTLNSLFAQLNGFVLDPSGTTDNFMRYEPKGFNVDGTNYITGYLTISTYKNLSTGQLANISEPFQKLQLQGGNILLCRTNPSSITPDINPTSRNGAILFSDYVISANNWIHGKWGIEYDDQFSTGGLNFFNPASSLTSNRLNFNLFIRNDGNVGIGTGNPEARLQIAEGDIFIQDINHGIIMKSPDGNCWRGTLNNQGQLEFSMMPECLIATSQLIRSDDKPSFRILPNPASDFLQIISSPEDLTRFREYSLYDSAGNQVKSGRLDQETCIITTGELARGAYIINITGAGKIWSEKVILN